jgi:phosphoribosylaminoimidazolecarboxamide formyltransferase/IMP cyclohydrolase
MEELEKHGIKPIDLVVVNFYPFEETIRGSDDLEKAIENIDIGGPSMLRSAAKNYESVGVVVDPRKYGDILMELKENNCTLSLETRKKLAAEAFSYTARYDAMISNYLRRRFGIEGFPDLLTLSYQKVQDLRYGENPHQKAALYRDETGETGVVTAKKLWGMELSYNNILDLEAALETVSEFENPACTIIKHNNPVGVATAERALEAYKLAYSTDPVSAFGGIVGLNREVDGETAREMSGVFLEAIIAPKFSEEALGILKRKKNIRLMEVEAKSDRKAREEVRSVTGGLLAQEKDVREINIKDLRVATRRAPSDEEVRSLLFAFKVVKHCRSNALVFARGERTISLGFGQPSRIDAARIGVSKGGEAIRGSVMASDGFLPFRDVVDHVADAGVTAIIQPGGSIHDAEVIEAANQRGIAMVFTGVRRFKH